MSILMTASLVCVAVSAALFAACALSAAREITYVTLADGRRAERSLPLVFRLLLPFASNLDGVVRRPSLARRRDEIARTLVAAGFEGLLTAEEFLALRLLVPVVVGGVWCLVSLTIASAAGGALADNRFVLALLGVALAWVWPASWLRGALKRRHLAILRALPFVLDLLTLSVEAGMDFMAALQRNCERRKLDALNEELIRMAHEIQVGTPRRIALVNLGERTRQADLRGVAHALAQADELGVSIGSILRIQSDQLRERRFALAEKLANEAPVKMLGPLMLCIFPAVFIVLLAPILVQAAKSIF